MSISICRMRRGCRKISLIPSWEIGWYKVCLNCWSKVKISEHNLLFYSWKLLISLNNKGIWVLRLLALLLLGWGLIIYLIVKGIKHFHFYTKWSTHQLFHHFLSEYPKQIQMEVKDEVIFLWTGFYNDVNFFISVKMFLKSIINLLLASGSLWKYI